MKEEIKKYPEEFKKQIVELYENGKSVINLEYSLVEQTIYKWIHRYETVTKDESGKDVSQADINVMKKRIYNPTACFKVADPVLINRNPMSYRSIISLILSRIAKTIHQILTFIVCILGIQITFMITHCNTITNASICNIRLIPLLF